MLVPSLPVRRRRKKRIVDSLPIRGTRIATLLLVADGVGGAAAGSDAARVATETIMRYVARTLRSYGTVPTAITFSPPLKLADGPRTLAVIFADDFVTLLDVEHPTRSEVTIGLTLPPLPHRVLERV